MSSLNWTLRTHSTALEGNVLNVYLASVGGCIDLCSQVAGHFSVEAGPVRPDVQQVLAELNPHAVAPLIAPTPSC